MNDTANPGVPEIRKIDLEAPWRWLTSGWRDFMSAPAYSLAYGAVFSLIGYALTWGLFQEARFHLLLPLASGFMLLGPLFAVGLYDVSRRLENGEEIHFGICWSAFRRNPGQIAFMGLILMLFMLAWVRIATLVYAIFFVDTAPVLDEFLIDTLLSTSSLPFLVIGTLMGAVLALAVFTISVISIPMLLDRHVDALSAIMTSIKAVRENWKAMWGWGCLIVLFTGAGIVTFYFGLVITLPLIGYASWHAYRDLIAH